jgi:hypothetical protein
VEEVDDEEEEGEGEEEEEEEEAREGTYSLVTFATQILRAGGDDDEEEDEDDEEEDELGGVKVRSLPLISFSIEPERCS